MNVGNVLTATISNLNDATTYLCSVSAYNSAGLESARSNEISYTTPSSPPGSYTLTVHNGTGDGTYPVDREVTVTANSPPPGQEFDDWEDDIAILDDFTSARTQALIIGRDVTITATYSAPADLRCDGDDTGPATGAIMRARRLTSPQTPPPAGQQFAGWTGNVTFANASSPNTSFTMPSSPVVVTATYSVSSGSALDCAESIFITQVTERIHCKIRSQGRRC